MKDLASDAEDKKEKQSPTDRAFSNFRASKSVDRQT